MLDGQVARMFDCETRTGAVLDILSDRLCAAAFYIGLAWLEPHLAPAVPPRPGGLVIPVHSPIRAGR